MASPIPELGVPMALGAGSLAVYFGHDATFWVVVLSATALKMFNTERLDAMAKMTRRVRWMANFITLIGAILPPFVGTKLVAVATGVEGQAVEYLIAIFLAVAGHGIILWGIKKSNDPESLIEWAWNTFRGKGK